MSNKVSRILALLMVSLALLSAPVLSESIDTPFAVTASAAAKKTPVLSAKKKTVYYKGSTTLKVKNYTKKVKWSTSNKKVAKVNSKGKVTAVGLGTCTITAKVGSKKLKCKVTVKDRNVSSSVSFKVNSGYFVKGESSATVTVKPKKYNAAKATVYIQNAEGKTVYKKTLTKLTKGKKYTFTWNGKNSKGNYVSGGSYRVKVKIGKKESYSSYLTFYAVNDFADGCGSSSNPFIVQNITHLKKTVKYPVGYFKQANDINFNYTAAGGLFSADQPFNGIYDGNGKTIMNISGTTALFDTIGEKGTVKNLNMKGCSVVAQYGAILAKENYGNIINCNVNGTVSAANTKREMFVGVVALNNYGKISDCKTYGTISAIATGPFVIDPIIGGISATNKNEGKILNCYSETSIKVSPGVGHSAAYAGGITGKNEGLISGGEVIGNLEHNAKYNGRAFLGGISGYNSGNIISSSYIGATSLTVAGENSGVIA